MSGDGSGNKGHHLRPYVVVWGEMADFVHKRVDGRPNRRLPNTDSGKDPWRKTPSVCEYGEGVSVGYRLLIYYTPMFPDRENGVENRYDFLLE